MKRFKIYFLCGVIIFAFLAIVRVTHTIDLSQLSGNWRAAIVALKQQYEKAKSFVGREVISPVLTKVLKSQEKAIVNNPYQNVVATVRIGNNLPPQEIAYRAKRAPKVKVALENLLGRSLDDKEIPIIALIGSGGGYRAMLCTTGFLTGAEKIGLWDAATYITALSGSTWALGPYMMMGWSWADFKVYLEGVVIKNIYKINSTDARYIADVFATKLAFNQSVTTVDLFGALLANRLLHGFDNKRQTLYLSQQASRIEDASRPYPIYTAIDGSEKVVHDAHWYEFTPYEVGAAAFGVYVPTWAFGREFFEESSLDFAPEQTLGFILGTCGSAFALHLGFVWDELIEDISNNILKSLMEKHVIAPLKGKRVFWAEVNNYMKGIVDIPNAYANLQTRETLKLVDAGIAFNLPYPPVSGERPERKADVMIFLDSSAGSIANELKKTEKYARKHGLKFPLIDYTDLEKKTFAVFKDETDFSVPVVIYMPRTSDELLWQENKLKPEFNMYGDIEGFDMEECTRKFGQVCNTLNFEYSEEQAQQVMNQMEFNMVVNKDNIIEVLNWVIDREDTVSQ